MNVELTMLDLALEEIKQGTQRFACHALNQAKDKMLKIGDPFEVRAAFDKLEKQIYALIGDKFTADSYVHKLLRDGESKPDWVSPEIWAMFVDAFKVDGGLPDLVDMDQLRIDLLQELIKRNGGQVCQP